MRDESLVHTTWSEHGDILYKESDKESYRIFVAL